MSEQVIGHELPAFFQELFVGVSDAVTQIKVHPALRGNADLEKQIPGWPDKINPYPFCKFSVPGNGAQAKGRPITTHNVHFGMGRGMSEIPLPLQKSPLARQLEFRDSSFRPGTIGVLDKATGMFYPTIGTKGNGPTAKEMLRLKGEWLGKEKRLRKREPWGIMWAETAETIEQPTLDALARISFRVGKVPAIFVLDSNRLAQKVDPLYETAGLDEYSVKKELAKNYDFNPGIMLRLAGGVRADVLSTLEANPKLVVDGLYAWSSEIARGGMERFINYYHFPESMHGDLERIKDYDFSQALEGGLIKSYLRILSFLMWRNYHLQDEYNKKFAFKAKDVAKVLGGRARGYRKLKDIIGPIWLNYKAGDWDVAGFMFDVDVFRLKMRLATKKGVKFVRDMDASSLNDGLSFIGRTLNKIDGCNWQEEIEFGRKAAEFVSKKSFLADDIKRQNFYSDPR